MASFEPDHLLLVLAERGVDFLVIGGIAATGGRLSAEYLGLWNSYHFVTPYGDFDCMATVPGAPAYEEAKDRAGEAPLEGYTIRVVDIDDLIAMKRATARPKDLATVDELLELRKLIEHERDQGEGDAPGLPPAAELGQ